MVDLLLLVGGGVEKGCVIQKARELGLNNIKFLPMQPREVYPLVLDASDVYLSTLRKNVETPVVPSKILSIIAAGKPVLACMPPDGDVCALIHEYQAGPCVEPENPQALAAAIVQIYQDSDKAKLLGGYGRRYAEEHFSRRACVAAYESIFNEAIERSARSL